MNDVDIGEISMINDDKKDHDKNDEINKTKIYKKIDFPHKIFKYNKLSSIYFDNPNKYIFVKLFAYNNYIAVIPKDILNNLIYEHNFFSGIDNTYWDCEKLRKKEHIMSPNSF